jgi:hypothetical protein
MRMVVAVGLMTILVKHVAGAGVRIFGGIDKGHAALPIEDQQAVLLTYSWVFGLTGALVIVMVMYKSYRCGPQVHLKFWPFAKRRKTSPEIPAVAISVELEQSSLEAVQEGEFEHSSLGLPSSEVAPTADETRRVPTLSAQEEQWLAHTEPTGIVSQGSPSRTGRSKLVVQYDAAGIPKRSMHKNGDAPFSSSQLQQYEQLSQQAAPPSSTAQRPRRKLKVNMNSGMSSIGP